MIPVREAAVLARVTRMTIYNWVKSKRLDSVDRPDGIHVYEDEVLEQKRPAVLRRAHPSIGEPQVDTAGQQ